METPAPIRIYPRHSGRSTHLVTTVADRAGVRVLMLRAAFRAGLNNRDTGENLAEGVEKSGNAAMIAEVGIVVVKALSEHGINFHQMATAACTFVALGAVTAGSKTFGRMAREQTTYSRELIKENPLRAMNDCLAQGQIWDELDANLLGRGIESMTSYIKRNTDDMLNRSPHNLADAVHIAQMAKHPQTIRAKVEELEAAAAAQRLFADHEMRQSLTDTWKLVDRCVRYAYREGMMRRGDKTANMVDELAQPALTNLVALGLYQRPVKQVPSKPAGAQRIPPHGHIDPL